MKIGAAQATFTIEGLSALSQSRALDGKTDKETHDAFDARCWRDKAHINKAGWVEIPAHGMHQCIAAAARHDGSTIKGQGKKTWTKKFETGIMIARNGVTNVRGDDLQMIALSVSSTGKRGVGGRVLRRFPIMPEWRATFDVYVLDPIITEDVFRRHLELAGIFIGLGRFRPEVGGHNGRFRLESIDWQDNRQLAA